MRLATLVSLLAVLTFDSSRAHGQNIDAADWAGIREAWDAGRHLVVAVPGGHQARNPGQAWLARFDGRGFDVQSDTAPWIWGLELRRYGFAGRERACTGAAAASAVGQRVTYARDELLDEWFVNDARGLEHGFTLRERPAGEPDDGPLAFALGVRGAWTACVQPGERGVRFTGADGTAVLDYAGLRVFDASGRTLPAHFETLGAEVSLVVDERGALYPVTIDPLAQQAYLKASNPEEQDQFGTAVAVSGDTVVVTAINEDSSATGVNGNQSDNGATDSGAAYVFVRSGGLWSQQAYLKASNTDAGDGFGHSVAISGDIIVVGAPAEDSNAAVVNGNQADNSVSSAGAAYVFVRNGTTWTQEAYLKDPFPEAFDVCGSSVAVSGETVAVGIGLDYYGSGAALVFVRSGTSWSMQAGLFASNWEEEDGFGQSMSLSGNTLVVGAPWESSSATGVNGNQASNGATYSGAAYVFVRNGTTWTQQAYLKASNTGTDDYFGSAVSVSGDTVVVGAPDEDSSGVGVNGAQGNNNTGAAGAAYVFARNGTSWSQQAYLKASTTGVADYFGRSVSVSGNTVAVGAYGEDSSAVGVNGNSSDNSAQDAGAVYVFARNGSAWAHSAYLKASNTTIYDYFGWSVALSGNSLVVGGIGDSSAASGVNGDQSDRGIFASGAAFVMDLAAEPQFPAIVDLTSGGAGTLGPTLSFDGTRGLDLTVLSGTDLRVSAMTLQGLSLGGASSALLGARIYSSSGALIASSLKFVTGGGGPQTVPIAATLVSGASYRVAFHLNLSFPFLASAQYFQPSAFPYVEASGLVRINSAHSSGFDSFPIPPSSFAPRILLDVTEGDWTDLGSALAGTAGTPYLAATGDLDTGSANLLLLTHAKPSAPATLIVGVAQLNAPFKGGTLVPVPLVVQLLSTNGAGAVNLPFVAPALPTGAALYFQYWIPDAAAVAGFAASNGLKGVAP